MPGPDEEPSTFELLLLVPPLAPADDDPPEPVDDDVVELEDRDELDDELEEELLSLRRLTSKKLSITVAFAVVFDTLMVELCTVSHVAFEPVPNVNHWPLVTTKLNEGPVDDACDQPGGEV